MIGPLSADWDTMSRTLTTVLLTLMLLSVALLSPGPDADEWLVESEKSFSGANGTGNGSTESMVEIVVYSPNGTMQALNMTLTDNWTAFEHTLSAMENMSIAVNSSIDSQLGGFVSSVHNSSSPVAFGDPLYWSWGFYIHNTTTGDWNYSVDGPSFVNLSVGDRIAWAPTIDGAWLNESLDTTIEALVAEIAAAAAAEIQRAFEAAMEIACAASQHRVLVGDDGMSFSHSHINASVGDIVCFYWSNESMPHNVVQVMGATSTTPIPGGFTTGNPDVNGSGVFILAVPGTQHFICEPHAAMGMRLTIEVEGELMINTKEPGEVEVPGFTAVLGTLALLGAGIASHRRRE